MCLCVCVDRVCVVKEVKFYNLIVGRFYIILKVEILRNRCIRKLFRNRKINVRRNRYKSCKWLFFREWEL